MLRYSGLSGLGFNMRYELEHLGTEFGTGWFACTPQEDLEFEDALEYIKNHPNDNFMHKYLLELAGKFGPNLTRQLIERGNENNLHLMALMYEACILNDRLHALISEFKGTDINALAQFTPLIYVNWSLKKGEDNKAYWLKLFSENILRHTPPTIVDELEFSIPFDQEVIDAWASRITTIKALIDQTKKGITPQDNEKRPGPAETSKKAMERLKAVDIKTGPEMENPASLCPYALQKQWFLHISVSTGRNHWQMTGLQTSYGKGLNIDQARASCLMEVVERVSSFASFDSSGALHYKNNYPLILSSYQDLQEKSYEVLDPNDMRLEAPYQNQPLYWIVGERVDENGTHPIYIPAQLVFLFCNLDEICLTSGLPSTGLASGNTIEEAKLHSLLEVIERDAESVMPYSSKRCFLLESDDPPMQDILQRCSKKGVQIQFLDITSEFGIPCYKAFIQGPNGEVLKGCAAHLDGKRAVVSALTELPFHPSWFPTNPVTSGLKKVKDETLPDYSSDSVAQDLRLLERLLVTNGFRPIYVNLTREDLNIPVVKALIPGLEMFAEFDRFSTLSPRQFVHYLNLWK